MKLAWVGLVFHVAMLLWLREDSMPSFKKSEPCGNCSERKRLMVVIIEGLSDEHGAVFRDFPEGAAGRVTAHKCPAPLSYFAGVAAAPLLPQLLDTVFDHVGLTVYSGRKEFILNKSFMKVKMPVYYQRRRGAKSERAELDGLAELLFKEIPKGILSPLRRANSTLFLLNIGGLEVSNVSLDIVRRLVIDIKHLAQSIDFMYGGAVTNVLLLGDNGGPFFAWGPSIDALYLPFQLRAADIAPLISALLGVAVPFDSIGRLHPGILICPLQRTKGQYCNSLQLSVLVDEITKGPTMEDLKYNSTFSLHMMKLLSSIHWYEKATAFGAGSAYQLSVVLQQAKMRLRQILAAVLTALVVSWIHLLLVELATVSYAQKIKRTLPFILIHVVFFLLTLSAAVLPFLMEWPYSFHLYWVCPFLFFWASVCRIEALTYFFKGMTWKEVPKYLACLAGTLLLAEYSLRASNTGLLALIIGLCILVHYPALPRFVASPFLAKCGWWVCCFSLLGALYLPQWTTGQPKLLNLCGTILICFSGFSSFWLKPFRDGMLSVLITMFIAAAMLMQSLSKAPQYSHQLKYVTGTMMLIPFLALFGKNRPKNRLFHAVFAFSALLMLTSNRLEPLCFLLAVLTCCLWTLMENFQLSDKLGTDEVRRAVFFGVILHTTVAVTQALPSSFVHLDSPQWIPLYNLYRNTMILSCLMTVYLTMIPSDVHTYSSYVVLLLADGFASLRALITGVDSTQLHLHGIAFALAFYIGKILAAPLSKLNDKEDDKRPHINIAPQNDSQLR